MYGYDAVGEGGGEADLMAGRRFVRVPPAQDPRERSGEGSQPTAGRWALTRNSLRAVCARCARTAKVTIALPDTDHRQEWESFGRDHPDTMQGTREPQTVGCLIACWRTSVQKGQACQPQ